MPDKQNKVLLCKECPLEGLGFYIGVLDPTQFEIVRHAYGIARDAKGEQRQAIHHCELLIKDGTFNEVDTAHINSVLASEQKGHTVIDCIIHYSSY